jgi:hypothetical protein
MVGRNITRWIQPGRMMARSRRKRNARADAASQGQGLFPVHLMHRRLVGGLDDHLIDIHM